MPESAERTAQGPEAHDPRAIHCVLWHPRGSLPPPDLVALLHERGIQPVLRDDRYTAFAKLCVRHARAVQDQTDQPLALLLIDPPNLDGVDEVVEAAAMYTPRAVCWVYQEDKGLRAYTPRPKTARHTEPSAPTARTPKPAAADTPPPAPRAPAASPSLRLAGEGPVTPPEDTDEKNESQSILTDEELAMLLADDEKDAAP